MSSTHFDLFISYQRASEAVASALYTGLTGAGFTVWQDVHNIRNTTRWSVEIDHALRTTDRLLLLLTPKSMASDEVFNEWFFFYNQRKPIHCLLVEKCDIHYQLLPFQYLVWQNPQPTDWERLSKELRADFKWPSVATDVIINSPSAPSRTLPDAMDALLGVVKSGNSVALSDEQVDQIAKLKPTDLVQYRLGRIAEWSKPRYQLDNRFVHLTLLVDKGETTQGIRWEQQQRSFTDLREVLAEVPEPAVVLLGAPGSGKSTLLRRLQLDDAIERLRDDGQPITFFIQLNEYKPNSPDTPLLAPYAWLKAKWQSRYPDLAPLETLVRDGRMLFLLDAINEMPHANFSDYHDKIGLWRQFLLDVVRDHPGNRAVFSCRSLDYSAPLSSNDLRVPQIRLEPMSESQVRQFLGVYLPDDADAIWEQLQRRPRQFDLFRTPYFLKLLIDQIDEHHRIPDGRAALFAGFVRQALRREIERDNALFRPDTLLHERDFQRMNALRNMDLPDRGVLIPKLSHLAYQMQLRGVGSESATIRIHFDTACELLEHERDSDILKAGAALNVLDEDLTTEQVLFFHQLLQEFFAARQFAKAPDFDLVRQAWRADDVSPSLTEQLASLAPSDPLPTLPATGWEETVILAAAMHSDPPSFVKNLMIYNLVLAGRAAAELALPPSTKQAVQAALVARSQDPAADLRDRIAAGLALGELGDPRFERRSGPHGDYLLPPLISIPAGTYPIGDDESNNKNEKPAHSVTLAGFQIGQFAVTNAEYALFMAAKGYEDPRWWEDAEAEAWRRGEGDVEAQRDDYRNLWRQIVPIVDRLDAILAGQRTPDEITALKSIGRMSEAQFNTRLEDIFPAGQRYTEPALWNNSAFNNPNQPVVGVCWYEARAYCAWLAAQSGHPFRLPTEFEHEAAARGLAGRQYAYGAEFDPLLGNTFETHIRRTTPIGVFVGGTTPEGMADLAGNTYDWTSSPYQPYQSTNREIDENNNTVTIKGGSWYDASSLSRAAPRGQDFLLSRNDNVGFRVVVSRPPSHR